MPIHFVATELDVASFSSGWEAPQHQLLRSRAVPSWRVPMAQQEASEELRWRMGPRAKARSGEGLSHAPRPGQLPPKRDP